MTLHLLLLLKLYSLQLLLRPPGAFVDLGAVARAARCHALVVHARFVVACVVFLGSFSIAPCIAFATPLLLFTLFSAASLIISGQSSNKRAFNDTALFKSVTA